MPEKMASTSPRLCSTPRLAAPIEAYSGPQMAMATKVAARKGLNGTEESPIK